VPVYHPLLFTTTFKLLRAKCMICHKFRLGRAATLMFVAKFRLLELGRVLDCMEVDVIRDRGTTSKFHDAPGKGKKGKSASAKKPAKKSALPTRAEEIEDENDADPEAEEGGELALKAMPVLSEEELERALGPCAPPCRARAVRVG
jgi:hypothetical protein